MKKIPGNIRWYLRAFAFSLVRLFARNMIVPAVRITLFRLTGIRIGKNVMINADTRFIDDFTPGMIRIDEGAAIAHNVTFVACSYANKSFIRELYQLDAIGKIHIKQGAWIGTGAVIQPGVTIGEGAIVGSNAVVTMDVEDFAIVVGIPAKKIGDVREKPRKRIGQ